MVKSDIKPRVERLPKGLFKERIFIFFPDNRRARAVRELNIFPQATRIARVCIETPECMTNMMLNHIIAQQFHPLLVLCAVHITAPLADEKRCNFLSIDICPCIVPIIVEQCLGRKVFLEPFLIINRRTIIVW